MTTNKTIRTGLNDVSIFIGERGVRATGRLISNQQVGAGDRKVRQTETTVEDRAAHEVAEELKGEGRRIVSQNSSRANRANFATDAQLAIIDTLLAEFEVRVAAHNAAHPNHALTVESGAWWTAALALNVMPVGIAGPAFDRMVTNAYSEIERTLVSIETEITLGNIEGARELITPAVSGNMGAILPMLVATMVDDALQQARSVCSIICDEIATEAKRAKRLGQSYSADPAKKGRDALGQGQLGKLESAIGWVTSREQTADDADTSGVAQ